MHPSLSGELSTPPKTANELKNYQPQPVRETHPQIPPDSFLWFYIHRNLGQDPLWTFPTFLCGNGLRCERLDFNNYHDLLELLKNDPNPFVDERFKQEQELYEYVMHQLACTPYSGKRGGVDYLIVDTPGSNADYDTFTTRFERYGVRVREGEEFCGMLHLYELSRERLAPDFAMPSPFVGIVLYPKARGRGIGQRAISLLESFVLENYPVMELTAMIRKENERSQRFFRSLGYTEQRPDEVGREEIFLGKQLPAREGGAAGKSNDSV